MRWMYLRDYSFKVRSDVNRAQNSNGADEIVAFIFAWTVTMVYSVYEMRLSGAQILCGY
jgi:hypothetical protein